MFHKSPVLQISRIVAHDWPATSKVKITHYCTDVNGSRLTALGYQRTTLSTSDCYILPFIKSRVRTNHVTLNAHLHRIKKEHQAKCVYCPGSDETVDHVRIHCPLYIRQQSSTSTVPVPGYNINKVVFS